MPDGNRARFCLYGSVLGVGGTAANIAHLARYLGADLADGAQGDPEFDLRIVYQDCDPVPGAALLLAAGPLPEAPEARLYGAAAETLLIIPGQLSARFDVARRRGLIGIVAGAEVLIGGMAGLAAIEAAASLSGQALVHAAALTLPGQDRAILLAAPSGAGKTTAALALALSGFGLLTDDAAMLRPADDGMTVWGLQRAVKVHRHTVAMLPGLAAITGPHWDAAGEQPLSLTRLAALALVQPQRPVPVAAIVHVGPRTGDASHTLRRMPRAEMLLTLAADNVGRGPRGMPESDHRRWQVLAGAVAETATFALGVGSDLATLGEVVSGTLRDVQA